MDARIVLSDTHTPGPWYYTGSSPDGMVYGANDQLLVPFNRPYPAMHADARLMAQAPAMLALLREMTKDIRDRDKMADARALLATLERK